MNYHTHKKKPTKTDSESYPEEMETESPPENKSSKSGSKEDGKAEAVENVVHKISTQNYSCENCKKTFASKKSLQNHMRGVHGPKHDYINSSRYLNNVCVDNERGIFLVRRNFSGNSSAVHCVLNPTAFTASGGLSCELGSCTDMALSSRRGGDPAFLCMHLRSAACKSNSANAVRLEDDVLDEIVLSKVRWFKTSRAKACVSLRDSAVKNNSIPVVELPPSSLHSVRYRHFSVYHGVVNYFSRFGRVVVTFDTLSKTWTCSCTPGRKHGCSHKSLTKWLLYQTSPSLLLGEDESDEERELEDESIKEREENLSSGYPPTGQVLDQTLTYLLEKKRIPTELPKKIPTELDLMNSFSRQLIPKETNCFHCGNVLSKAILITKKGLLLTTLALIEGRYANRKSLHTNLS